MPFAPPFRRPSNHALATIAIAACAACADFAAPTRRAARSAPIRALHVDSIAGPARVVAGDSLRVTLHGACREGETVETHQSSAFDFAVRVYDLRDGRSREGCAPLVVGVPTHALPPYVTPPTGPVRIRVAVARPRGASLVHTATLRFGDSTHAPR